VIPGVPAEYTVELLHTSKYTKCETSANKQDSMIDMSTGTFQVRVTGRATTDRSAKRSVIVTFRRESFLKIVYFTDQENRDPQAATTSSERNRQQTNCSNRYRTARTDRGCLEIQFASSDKINGPLHTNDESLLVCGTPIFGREKNKDGSDAKTDAIEVGGLAPGYVFGGGCPTSPPAIWSPTRKFTVSARPLKLPRPTSP
jgi:hypothetical protein